MNLKNFPRFQRLFPAYISICISWTHFFCTLRPRPQWLCQPSHLMRLNHFCMIPHHLVQSICSDHFILFPVTQNSSRTVLRFQSSVGILHSIIVMIDTPISFPMIALAIYDLILSFSAEQRCIWKRKVGTGTILYLSIRYGTILYRLTETGMLSQEIVPLIVSVEAQYIAPD